MTGSRNTPQHVSLFIRQQVIPPGMSVTEAAQRLGVSRPTLSNLLNGKASLSPRMAVRLEKAFGADRQALLDLQAVSDNDRRRDEDRGVGVRAYVPSFLTIKANHIERWAANNIDARHLLSVLLRKLIRSTGRGLRHVDFPGYDNAERPGWDGWVRADEATAWIPEGESGWELSTSQDPWRKADRDYAARLATVESAKERANTTFVFVAPRRWPKKNDWEKTKQVSGGWKSVRALDASDLEQWLEESIAAQIWLAEKLALPVDGVRTLDECWARWAEASDPQMTAELFEPSVAAYRIKLKEWLDEPPNGHPLVVSADSKDEAIAFLACLFRDGDVPEQPGELAAVFESAQTLRTLAPSSSPFIPIVHTTEVERELGAVSRWHHCIVVRPRNTVDRDLDVALHPLGHEAFRTSLTAMGIEPDRIERLARESGRSPTVLRRRLSKIPAIKMPGWAEDPRVARSLIPIALIGAWHAGSRADRERLHALADRPYQEIEQDIQDLLQLDDCPVWSVDQYRGVASKMDALFAIRMQVTERDLANFLVLAEYVLSESDPALELPEDQRWAASIYGKARDHSAALRSGVCETLVMLSVHGDALFRDRLGIDLETRVANLIRRLLTPLTLEKLRSHDHNLPRYAEAAPDEFLTLIETDLTQPEPAVRAHVAPADTGVFGGCPRTGFLWAMECLAWSPKYLARTCVLLAQLSSARIDDNWEHKPFLSLAAIFRSWIPQTAASVDDRGKTLKLICNRFPDVGWKICIEQLRPGPRSASPSYRPRWRSDASGAGEPVTRGEKDEFDRKALDLALAWREHDRTTLGDLIECLASMSEVDQSTVWGLIDAWSRNKADEKAIAGLRERIRRFALTMRGRRRNPKAAMRERAREVYERLAPRDPVIRHTWLFAKPWFQETLDGIEDEYLDLSKREERIDQLRTEAMKEIWAEHGLDGAITLLADSEAPGEVGRYAAICASNDGMVIEVLWNCLSDVASPERKLDGFMEGFIASIAEDARDAVLTTIAEQVTTVQAARLFRCAPFGSRTWRLMDDQPQEVRDRYWREVPPFGWNTFSETDWAELIDRLLEAERPRAAFQVSSMHWEKIETSRLKRLLMGVATTSAEPVGSFPIDPYDISNALDVLGGGTDVTPEEMAQLEFIFVEALELSEHGIPNLERQIAESPNFFVHALALVYQRNDGDQDPPEWYVEDPDRRSAVAKAAYRLLDLIKRIPETDADGQIHTESLRQWVEEVRRKCVEFGRAEIGDHRIGQLLSRATSPYEENGPWPCGAVCEVMEDVASEHMADGFLIGALNARGVYSGLREGGRQERELAMKYRGWAEQRAFEYPHVSSVLHRIADSYGNEATRHDSEMEVRWRLRD